MTPYLKKGNRRLIVLGDRVLISPSKGEERTKVGLYLPQTVSERESVQSGTVMATGPGTPLAEPIDLDNEPWKSYQNKMRYVPMEVNIGDQVIFLKKAAVEIKYDGKTYLVVPQSAILVILREDSE